MPDVIVMDQQLFSRTSILKLQPVGKWWVFKLIFIQGLESDMIANLNFTLGFNILAISNYIKLKFVIFFCTKTGKNFRLYYQMGNTDNIRRFFKV